MNPYIPYNSDTAELEQAYLNDLALDHTINRLDYASKELDRLIEVLKNEEANQYLNASCHAN